MKLTEEMRVLTRAKERIDGQLHLQKRDNESVQDSFKACQNDVNMEN